MTGSGEAAEPGGPDGIGPFRRVLIGGPPGPAGVLGDRQRVRTEEVEDVHVGIDRSGTELEVLADPQIEIVGRLVPLGARAV
ncbi:MAG: hypothetical protein MZV63_58975 [Marinilabiliales bacterium]|nr:hypothetical protein [Marinilabiliales bacterium]